MDYGKEGGMTLDFRQKEILNSYIPKLFWARGRKKTKRHKLLSILNQRTLQSLTSQIYSTHPSRFSKPSI